MELLKEELIEEELVETEKKEEEEFIVKNYEFPYEKYTALIQDRTRNKCYAICLNCGKSNSMDGYYASNLYVNCDCKGSKRLRTSYFYNEEQYGFHLIHVAKVKYNNRYFEAVMKRINFLFRYDMNKRTYVKNLEELTSEVTVKFEILQYNKKQNKMDGCIQIKEYKTNGNAEIKTYPLLKKNFDNIFSCYSLSEQVDFVENIVKLGLAPCENNSSKLISDTLWNIFTNYKRFNFLIENNVGILDSNNLKEKEEQVDFLKNNPFYLKVLSEEVEKKVDEDKSFNEIGWGGIRIFMNEIFNKYPTENPRYYEVYGYLKEIDDDVFKVGYYPREFALAFLNSNYTNQEISEYVEACNRQAFKPSYECINDTFRVSEIAGVPMVKTPKEMCVFYRRMDYLDRLSRLGENYKEIIKKAFNMKNGQELLDKILYFFYKEENLYNVYDKNQLLIIYSNKEKDVEIIASYDKDLKEITVEKAKEILRKERVITC